MFAHRFCMHALAAAVTATTLAACSQTRPTLAGPDPADPHAHARTAAYRSVIGPYESRRPVEPAPWRDQNDRIAPAPQP